MMAAPEQCSACGAMLRDDVAHCVSCGLPRPTASAAPTSAPTEPAAVAETATEVAAPAAEPSDEAAAQATDETPAPVEAASAESPEAPMEAPMEAPETSAAEPTPELVEIVPVASNDEAQPETVVAVESVEAVEASADEPDELVAADPAQAAVATEPTLTPVVDEQAPVDSPIAAPAAESIAEPVAGPEATPAPHTRTPRHYCADGARSRSAGRAADAHRIRCASTLQPADWSNRAGGLHRDHRASDHPGQQRTSPLLNRRGAGSGDPLWPHWPGACF